MQPKLLLLAALASGTADAASADLLKGLISDGVFRQVRLVPADRLLRGGPGTSVSTVRFTFTGGKKALDTGGVTVGKLLGRMTGRAAASCFSVGAERVPGLKSWLKTAVKTAQDTTQERSFGPLKVHLLINRTDGDPASPDGLTEVDVLLGRKGTPGTAPWIGSCTK